MGWEAVARGGKLGSKVGRRRKELLGRKEERLHGGEECLLKPQLVAQLDNKDVIPRLYTRRPANRC